MSGVRQYIPGGKTRVRRAGTPGSRPRPVRTAHPSWRRPARNWAPHGRCEPVASPRSRRPSRRRRPRAASPRGRRGGRRIARAPSGVCLIPPTARAPRRSASRTAHRTCSPMRSRDPGDIAPSATHAVHGHPHPESHSPDRGQRLDRLPSAAPRGKGYARGRTTQERSSWGGIGSRAKPRSKAASSWPRDTAATTNTRAQDQSAILVTRLLERLGALAPGRMRQTDHALALVLGISEAG